MSARNYMFSARDKNISKVIDCLPQINEQKHVFRSGREFPTFSANSNKFINRNINCLYALQNYDNLDRAVTPYSDFFSESETGTPDFHSEESDSSAGSALNRNTAEATKVLQAEWEKIERTLYNEEGEKSNRPQIIEECEQWRKLHPQFRVVGKSIPIPDKRSLFRQNEHEHEEVIAMHYSDFEQFSESEERLSESSTDVTPENSPRTFTLQDFIEPKLSREKLTYRYSEDLDISDTFCSLLHITPLHIHSPYRKKQNPSIFRSDITSSKWMRNTRPDSSINYGRSSAKSFVSLDMKNYKHISASDNSKIIDGRVLTAKQREGAKLEPLYTVELNEPWRYVNGSSHNIRKVSLPPLFQEEDRKKIHIGSGKRSSKRKSISKLDKSCR